MTASPPTEIATENPNGACNVLAAVVSGAGRDELRVVGSRVRELLEAIVAATETDADARAEAERLVDELVGEHGLGDYRDALSPNEPPAGWPQLSGGGSPARSPTRRLR
jgi:hypothetical protein